MSEEGKSEGNNLGKVDSAFQKILNYVGKQISNFVAFLFLLFTAGIAFGMYVTHNYPEYSGLFILIPALLGLVAYYNRTVAIIALIALMSVFFI